MIGLSVTHLTHEALGLLGTLLCAWSFFSKDDLKMKKYYIGSCVVWVAAFGVINAFGAMAITAVFALRALLSISWSESPSVGLLSTVAVVVVGGMFCENPKDLLPILGGVLATFAFFGTNRVLGRWMLVVSCLPWLVYSAIIMSVSGILIQLLLLWIASSSAHEITAQIKPKGIMQ